jgi:transposase
MGQFTAVGLDVHARSITGCGIDLATGEISTRKFGCDYDAVIGWLGSFGSPARVVYEAGPTGFGLARALSLAGIDYQVAAPSKLLGKPGDRVKTDRKDAHHLAELVSCGLVTAIRVPSEEEEAVRDLLRAREDARVDLTRAKQRLDHFLLRHGVVYPGTGWTKTHILWLQKQRFDHTPAQAAFMNDLAAVLELQTRRDDLDAELEELARTSPYQPVVTALGCLRGVSTITGFGLAVEIGDWSRFTGSSIGAFVGLVPCEYSSGQTRSLGGVTKTGNKHARRLLVEAAWHHEKTYNPHQSKVLQDRWAKATPLQRRRGDQANRRLHQQWVNYNLRKKRRPVANAAIARQLAGFCWSLAMMAE